MNAKTNGAVMLRRWREGGGMSQAAAAATFGVSLSLWCKLETSVRVPGRKLSLRLEEVAGVPVKSWDEPACEEVQPAA